MSGGGLELNPNIEKIAELADLRIRFGLTSKKLYDEFSKRGMEPSAQWIKSLEQAKDDLQYKLNEVKNAYPALIGQPDALVKKVVDVLEEFIRGPKKKKNKPKKDE